MLPAILFDFQKRLSEFVLDLASQLERYQCASNLSRNFLRVNLEAARYSDHNVDGCVEMIGLNRLTASRGLPAIATMGQSLIEKVALRNTSTCKIQMAKLCNFTRNSLITIILLSFHYYMPSMNTSSYRPYQKKKNMNSRRYRPAFLLSCIGQLNTTAVPYHKALHKGSKP